MTHAPETEADLAQLIDRMVSAANRCLPSRNSA